MDGSPATRAVPLLLTARLRLVAADEALAEALAEFHERNRAHLAPWDPPTPADFFTPAAQASRLRESAAAYAAGTGVRYLLQPSGDPSRVVGNLHFSNIVRGVVGSVPRP
jgi:ribosomal-protein-alanine N-acetyltransferase